MRGLLFAGSQIVTETWQEKIKVTGRRDGDVIWPTSIVGHWWELTRLEVVQLPGSDDDVDPPENGDFLDELAFALKMLVLIGKRVRTVGFTESQGSEIGLGIFYMLISPACVNAFREAQLPTPAEVIRDRGLVLANSELLLSSSNNAQLGISESQRREHLPRRRFGSDAFTDNRGNGPVYTFYHFWGSPNYETVRTP